MAMYKQKCVRCRSKYVLVGRGQRYAICYDCQKDELNQPIKDPKMKKMFDIPEDMYRESLFLRSIKSNYLRFGELSEKQIEAFKKTVETLKEKAKEAKKSE